MNLFFIHGLPGVGKLTTAQELVQLTNYKLFHNHLAVNLVGSIFDFGSEPFVELREQIWLTIFRRAIQEGISGLVFTFVFEQTVSDHFLTDVVEILEEAKGNLILVELRCDEAELKQRIVNHSREKFDKIQSVSMLDQLLEEGVFNTPPLPDSNLVLDTTELSPAQTAYMILNHHHKNLEKSPTRRFANGGSHDHRRCAGDGGA